MKNPSQGWSGKFFRVWRDLGLLGTGVALLAAFLLPVIVVILKVVGQKRTEKLLVVCSPSVTDASQINNRPLTQIVEGVRVAAAYGLVRAVCLPKSMFLTYLLRWCGVHAEVRIGISKTKESFRSHAWVEVSGAVVNDRLDIAQEFTVVV